MTPAINTACAAASRQRTRRLAIRSRFFRIEVRKILAL
jgi:hypothetical protein